MTETESEIKTRFKCSSVLIARNTMVSGNLLPESEKAWNEFVFGKMAGVRIRNSAWEEDEQLKEDLQRYVLKNMSRKEVLDFVSRDYPQYAWSLGTLSRRLSTFNIKYIDYDIPLESVERAVQQEINGPGRLLGIRTMLGKVREVHHLPVPRNLVNDVMAKVDPEGLAKRGNVGQKKRRRGATGTFTSLGPNHTHSADGHDKLMGYMNSTFPLAVYALQDVFSGYVLFLKVWTTNSDPDIIGRWYLEHLYHAKVISRNLRLDRGSETGQMATIHSFLRHDQDDNQETNTVLYGPSTSNKIERWWRELHHGLEKYFKRQLAMLLEQGHYDPNNQTDRYLLAFVFIPVVQKEMDTFRETVWNSHRVRCQKDAQMPKGIPSHLYNFPEQYDAEELGVAVSSEALDEVAALSGVMSVGEDFLPESVRAECKRVIPNLEGVMPDEAADTYLYLKAHYHDPSSI